MNPENKPRIAVVTQAPFPVGNVSTLRYTSYLKSLSKNGAFTYVLIYCPTRMATHIKQQSGITEDGIKFRYATDITWRKYTFLNKVIYLIKGLYNSIGYLRREKISTLILYGNNPFAVNLFYWLFCKCCRVRFIGDRSELPTEKERNSKVKLFFYGVKQRMFDGMIIMTKGLLKFYSQYSKKGDFLFFLPMTIDPDRFEGISKDCSVKPYIAVVFGTHNRDGLLESLKSYDLYCEKGGTYDLDLIGDYQNMPNKNELDLYLTNSSYRNRIKILGLQSNDNVPKLLYNASILLTTPNHYVSGGFPTKLGEYMLSGVPIVATIAGELLDYVTPEEDMLMSAPKDYNAISDNLLKLETNESLAQYLSHNARQKALKSFCADSYVETLMYFLLHAQDNLFDIKVLGRGGRLKT